MAKRDVEAEADACCKRPIIIRIHRSAFDRVAIKLDEAVESTMAESRGAKKRATMPVGKVADSTNKRRKVMDLSISYTLRRNPVKSKKLAMDVELGWEPITKKHRVNPRELKIAPRRTTTTTTVMKIKEPNYDSDVSLEQVYLRQWAKDEAVQPKAADGG